jgi:hypothetical protein
MIKNLLKKKIEEKFNAFCIDYLEKVLFHLDEDQSFRTFQHFLEMQGIELDDYISFSPEKLIDDYIKHIDVFFKNAELSLISITSEKLYAFLSLIKPLYTKRILFKLIENLKDEIDIEKEIKVSLAIQLIKNTIVEMNFEEENIH